MNDENLTMNAVCDITGNTNPPSNPMPLPVIMPKKISGIYKIVNKVNGKYYVGSSYNINTGADSRWRKHLKMLRIGKHYNKYLQRAWIKYGESNFEFIIVEAVDSSIVKDVEQKYLDIAKLEKNKVYNGKFYVTGEESGKTLPDDFKLKLRMANLGKKASDETRLKMRLSHLGKPKLKARGRKLSAETIAKIKAYKFTDEVKLKMSLSHIGKKLTEEAKLKLRVSRLGILNPNYGKRPSEETLKKLSERMSMGIAQIDKEGNTIKIFPSMKIAAECLKVNSTAISRVCSGVYKHTHGLYFKLQS